MRLLKFLFLFLSFALLISCHPENNSDQSQHQTPNPKPQTFPAPNFNADSSYLFVKTQVDFGPRVPNTKAHEVCKNYLVAKLKSYTPYVIVQSDVVTAFDKTPLNFSNIIAQFNPARKNRILLCAHWDCRPWSDQDTVRKNETFDGANDAASGVGVLLEMARILDTTKINIGVDIIFLDVEDWGSRSEDREPGAGDDNSYGLGTQYWAQHPHVPGYTANFGVLLDMVGGAKATFSKEGYSRQYAQPYVDKVWNAAANAGYSDFFLTRDGGFVIDDHYYVNTMANIPCIDIIHSDTNTRSNFPSYWHTHRDNMSVIDKATLKAVGQTLLEVVYGE